MANLSLDTFLNSELYKITIIGPGANGTYGGVGYLTSQINLNAATEWEAALPAPSVLEGVNKYIQKGAGTAQSTLPWTFTEQAWVGSQPLQISFTLGFIASNNARTQVLEPTQKLLAIPGVHSTTSAGIGAMSMDLMVAPASKSIGYYWIETSFLKIGNLLPVSSDVNYSTTLTKEGLPVSAEMNLTFMTNKAVLRSEILRWFK